MVEILFTMPVMTQQDPGFLPPLQNDLPRTMACRFRAGLLVFPSRRSRTEAILPFLVDEQSAVPFHRESLGPAEPAARGVIHGQTVAHGDGLHLLGREYKPHGGTHVG